MGDEPVGTLVDGDVGRIILRRPRALNSLTTEMVELIDGALREWQDLGLRAVLIGSDSDNFCAGGDVRALRSLALEERWDEIEHFFATEYRMNRRIAEYPVPVVSLIDGMCMGGGMGLSMHGALRVVTERAVLAMPETTIGFVPDVGASHFLSRLPGAVGMYLGLTGYRMTAADALEAGLATHLVPAAELGAVGDAIVAAAGVDPHAVLDARAVPSRERSALADDRHEIDAVFSAPTVAGILERLDERPSAWSRETGARLRRASPSSLAATHELIARARGLSLRECLDAELLAAMRMVRAPDFAEGVRAALVDKDGRPRWAAR